MTKRCMKPLGYSLLITILFGLPGLCDNLVLNGNFALGNKDFSSGYTFVTDSSGNCFPEGVYTIGTNPHSCHPFWPSFPPLDPTGKMMMVNGAPTSGVRVWSETVAIVPGSTYDFMTSVASLSYLSPAVLQFSVNGTQVGSNFTADSTTGVWTQFCADWNSGTSTAAVLTIVDLNIIPNGNDFALDDISFSGPAPADPPVPEPSSFVLTGAPFLVLLLATFVRNRRGPLLRSR
jgi:hypothetical protein